METKGGRILSDEEAKSILEMNEKAYHQEMLERGFSYNEKYGYIAEPNVKLKSRYEWINSKTI